MTTWKRTGFLMYTLYINPLYMQTNLVAVFLFIIVYCRYLHLYLYTYHSVPHVP